MTTYTADHITISADAGYRSAGAGRTSLRGYPRGTDGWADWAENWTVPDGCPVIRFDLADDADAVHFALTGPIPAGWLPAGTVSRCLGDLVSGVTIVDGLADGKPIGSMDLVSMDVYVQLATAHRIPVQYWPNVTPIIRSN